MRRKKIVGHALYVIAAVAFLLSGAPAAFANALVPGINGPTFNLSTGTGSFPTPDGDNLFVWLYADDTGGTPEQYPGPTLIVNEGQTVTVNLINNLTVPTSIVFPGQGEVTASGGTAGLLTNEAAANGGSVSYSFLATNPGTYIYHSGTNPELQIEMGLVGALIVRPTGYNSLDPTTWTAYGTADTAYDHEYLFLLTEMDPYIHDLVDYYGNGDLVDNTDAYPVFWFINGRNGLNTLDPNDAPWLPHQPYSSLARTRPGERVLLRLIDGGRNQHAFHPHGNHSLIVARDGRLLSSNGGTSANLAINDFTITPTPGGTVDAIFNWTSKDLGWDIYGTPTDTGQFAHDCTPAGPDNIDADTGEDCDFHGVPIPVDLPGLQDLSFGGWYSGSPFLGQFGQLPPGEGGLNLHGGLFYMWHSHNEKELTNFDIFPGGMLTFVVVEPPLTPIP